MNSLINQFFSDHVPRFSQALDEIDRRVDPQEEPLSDSSTRCSCSGVSCGSAARAAWQNTPIARQPVQNRTRKTRFIVSARICGFTSTMKRFDQSVIFNLPSEKLRSVDGQAAEPHDATFTSMSRRMCFTSRTRRQMHQQPDTF